MAKEKQEDILRIRKINDPLACSRQMNERIKMKLKIVSLAVPKNLVCGIGHLVML